MRLTSAFFVSAPENLSEIHARLASLDADVVKIATMANELLAMAARRELREIDQKLYFEIFANHPNRRPAGTARPQPALQ